MRRIICLFSLFGLFAAPIFATDTAPVAAKPLFRDPVFDGAADPVVVWNPHVQRWWMFYTNRRANAPGLSGVAWVHGSRIGITESADGGANWSYVGTADIELTAELGGTEPTHWAPDVITAPDGTHHMFLTVVPGVFEGWQHPRTIVHLTSTDLRHWRNAQPLQLASDRVIDAVVQPLPTGGWRLWYNNERDHKSIYYADSPDLATWTDRGKCTGVGERPGEGPYVFHWKGVYWMLVDLWQGLGVYRSDDLLHWTAQTGNLLDRPGTGPDDGVNGGHPGVVVSADRAYLFYFTHPGRAGTIKPEDKNSLELRRSSIQVVELFEKDGRLECDRNRPVPINLQAPAPFHVVDTSREPMQSGKFVPTWESLAQYEVPEWFRDAKFGIWAHWGPQCEPEQGDWYARHLYLEKMPSWGRNVSQFHRQKYGHPSQFGFKDVIHRWKAEHWNPDRLVALYKRAGAQYFFALANHHDNFDLWDSKYQPWNAVRLGPQQDLIGGWARAARANDLRFGVSVHAAHAWSWYEVAQGADTAGEFAGVPYDGKLTKADGKGQWWDGLDPQDLYEQRHAPSPDFANADALGPRWNWGNGVSIPDAAYCERFYDRTLDLINRYQPDLVYFDDTALPLWPISDAGLKIAAHYYNANMQAHGGKLEAVLFGKILNEQQRHCMVWDIERGQSNVIEPLPWQTDTCLGDWHYDRSIFEQHRYKSVKTVIQTLADVVSKNGNLLLNVPVRGDGTIDDDELAVVEGIAAWMDVNKEAIFGTRPWKVFGEGPASAGAALTAQGFNEGKGKPFTAADVRFTTKGDVLYAISLGRPSESLALASLGKAAGLLSRPIAHIELLGGTGKVDWTQTDAALVITPAANLADTPAAVFRITVQ